MINTEKLTFQVDRLIYSNNGFHIVKTTSGDSVSGRFNASEGRFFESSGVWDKTSPKARRYGSTFKIEVAQEISPTDNKALGDYLVRKFKGKGLGEGFFSRLVKECERLSLRLERLLDTGDSDSLSAAAGPRHSKKISTLLSEWSAIKPQADLMSPLMGYGLSEAQANALLERCGKHALDEVKKNPYELIHTLSGISFLRADRIAMRVGNIKADSSVRLRAAFATGLREATANGDLGVKRTTLIRSTKLLVNDAVTVNGKRVLDTSVPLKVPEALLKQTLDAMLSGKFKDPTGSPCKFSARLQQGKDEKDAEVIWFKPLLEAEDRIVSAINRLSAPARPDFVEKAQTVVKALDASLAPEQWVAIRMVFENPVSIITGGPGCGKTFIQKLLLSVFAQEEMKGDLAAPSGKAAKRMKESTGHCATTIHSLIKYCAGDKAVFNVENPLESDFLILDEMSMADTELTAAALSAVKPSCRVVLVGDVDQLSSVGPGQVLRDMIRSGRIPCTKLTKGFRFGKGSDIAKAARAINRGSLPKDKGSDSAFELIETEQPLDALLKRIESLLRSGVRMEDILVLSPTNKGRSGCEALNRGVQNIVNPPSMHTSKEQPLRRDSGDIYVNDRVIQTRNDYELGIVNGDLGWVDEIRTGTGCVSISLQDGDRQVEMTHDQSANLKLAYAISIHKSQGSEAPYVLMAIDSAATFMLRRNLIYTGITRASKKVVMFAATETLAHALRIGEPAEGRRHTLLCAKLKEGVHPPDEEHTKAEVSGNAQVTEVLPPWEVEPLQSRLFA